MRITVKPPSPAPPALAPGALLTVRVEAADPAPLLAGPPSVAYEGRYADTPAPGAFLFPGNGASGPTTTAPAASDFRTPPAPPLRPYVDVDAHEGDVVTAVLTVDNKTYSAAHRVGNPPSPRPVTLQLAEGASAPPPPTPPGPNPADGLTITPLQQPDLPPPLEEGDVVRLDTAPGADNLVVLVPAP